MLFNVSNRMLRAHGDPSRRSSRSRSHSRRRRAVLVVPALVIPVLMLPVVASAQTSPFLTGATALQSNILAWLTPIAVILITVQAGTRCRLRRSPAAHSGAGFRRL
jgi:hypothetical protein